MLKKNNSYRGKVIGPDSKEKNIKTPRRLIFFDDVLLRDLQLSQSVGGIDMSLIVSFFQADSLITSCCQ